MLRLSPSTTSTTLGSLPLRPANSRANGEGETSPRSTSRPSAFETAFCVTTDNIARLQGRALCPARARHELAQPGAGPYLGQARYTYDLDTRHRHAAVCNHAVSGGVKPAWYT